MEIIIGLIILFVIYSFFKAKSQIRSAEFGTEARYIAVNELGVPNKYFTFIVTNAIEHVKNDALLLKEKNGFSAISWPRLMAYIIYIYYYNDCKKAFYEQSDTVINKLNRLDIGSDEIMRVAQSPEKISQKMSGQYNY